MKRLIPVAIAFNLALMQFAHADEPCPKREATQRHPVLSGEPSHASLPPALEANGVRYMSGGIGVDAATAMRKVRSQYVLAVTFLLLECGADEFLANMAVTIVNEEGLIVTQLNDAGPYLYIDLPPGAYRLTASAAGREPKEFRFHIFQEKQKNLIVRWVGT